MNKIVELLHAGNYSCVIQGRNGEIRTFSRRGVIDLYKLIENDLSFLNGASVADKVVGKAAASLMILSGVTRIYTDIISEPAFSLLEKAKIGVTSRKVVPFIQNRDKSGICPLESICSHTDSLEELFPLIEEFIRKIT